jgi:hypothetical protein
MAIVAVSAIAMAALKAAERERARQSLGRVRLYAALQGYQECFRRFDGGEVRLNEVYTWSRRVLESQRELENTRSGRASAAAAHLSRMKTVRKTCEMPEKKGECLDPSEARALDYLIKEAEYWVAAEK